MTRMKTWEAAVLVLRETGNDAVMWGDECLLHMIAERAGLRSRANGWRTSAAVLNNLSRNPGPLDPRMTLCGGRERLVRVFRLRPS
jgi:hypothetical protein